MSFSSAPFPVSDAIVKRDTLRPTKPFVEWVTALTEDVDAAPARLNTSSSIGNGASIGATTLGVGALAAGLYRVEYYARITQPGTVSSSLTVTIGWTESAIALSTSGAAMTGNTTATVQSGAALVRIDQASPLTYSTTYASVGATPMLYRLDVVLSQVDA